MSAELHRKRVPHTRPMRYVVKDKETGQFLNSVGKLTPHLSEAQLFPNGLSVNLHLEQTSVPGERLQIVELPSNR